MLTCRGMQRAPRPLMALGAVFVVAAFLCVNVPARYGRLRCWRRGRGEKQHSATRAASDVQPMLAHVSD